MNERIKELMTKCNYVVDGTCDTSREEKFAELIIRECNKAVLEVPCYYKDDVLQIEECTIIDCGRAVLEHFGVNK